MKVSVKMFRQTNPSKLSWLPLLAVVGSASLMAAGEVKFNLPAETATLKSAPGIELAASQCLLCHSADYISTQPRLSRAAWKAAVIKMQQKYGAPIQTNTLDAIVEYLARNYGAESAKAGTPTK